LTPEAVWVKAIKEPKTDITFTEEEKARVLGGAARKVFNI
jgi:hypothetical protein